MVREAPHDPPAAPSLERAEPRGHWLLEYVPSGPLGGALRCARCGAEAPQPDLIAHRAGCPYREVR